MSYNYGDMMHEMVYTTVEHHMVIAHAECYCPWFAAAGCYSVVVY